MAHFVKKHYIVVLTSAFIMSACSHLSSQTESLPAETTQAQSLPKEPLNGESLFQILLAEIATNRGDYGAAAALYGEIGSNHSDVNAIERAIGLNQSIGNYDKMLELAQRWVELRPTDATALRALSLSTIATGQVETGIEAINKWLVQDPQADISLLIPGLQSLSEQELGQVNTGLATLQAKHPKSASLLYTRSRLELVLKHPETALELANQSLDIEENVQVSLFKFQLLLAKNDIKSATDIIRTLDKRHPENKQVAIAYARFIYQYEPENLARLEILNNRFATEAVITRTYARAAFEQQDYDAAQAVFRHLLERGFTDEAHYYLGLIDLLNVMPDAAVAHFEAVTQPPYLTSAMAEWAGMGRIEDKDRIINAILTSVQNHPAQAPMLRRIQTSYYQRIGDTDLAWQTLSAAVVDFPTDIPLLYDQAMLAPTVNRTDVMEANLVTILELDPENINALNALGYSWADANKNLPKAKIYIEKALAADPENAAYQDSKGWYLYRVGDNEGALLWLKKAYEQFENDEVAAHIAEVLWKMNRAEEAKVYLNEIKRLNPESRFIGILNELFAQ